MTALLFGVAAGVGALARWQMARSLPLPYGTLAVNVIGAFALGLLDNASPDVVTAAGIGGLGAFTTFSTLTREFRAIAGDDSRGPGTAAAYLIVTLVAGIGAAALGIALAP